MISCIRSSFSHLLGQQNFRFISALKIFHAQYKQCRFVILVTWEFRYCSQKLGENHYNEPEKAKLAVLCAFWPGGQEFVRTQEFSTLCYIIQLSWSNRRTSKIAREDNPATSKQCFGNPYWSLWHCEGLSGFADTKNHWRHAFSNIASQLLTIFREFAFVTTH